MSKEFKGQPGGDPSRMPPMVELEWSCKTCGKTDTIQTRKPKSVTIPEYCGATCSDLQYEPEARELVLTRLGAELPETHLISSGVFRSVVKYGNLLTLAEKSPSRVIAFDVLCPQCNETTTHYRSKNEAPRKGKHFCSATCGQSSRAKLPVGISCRNAFKKRFSTEAEAVEAVTLANIELAQGDKEDMVAYACTCGSWHFGHLSKAIAEKQAMAARDALKDMLTAVLP